MNGLDATRIRAVVRKELRDYRRKRAIVVTMAVLPILFLIEPVVTIFLTTHRLDEAEKLCDRVAILNTTLRTIGRPADLRAQLFKSALIVETLKPLIDPDALFASLPAVESWSDLHDGTYEVVVADPRLAAPEVTRGLVGAGADVVSIGEAQHSLEDVYLELVNEDVEAQRP